MRQHLVTIAGSLFFFAACGDGGSQPNAGAAAQESTAKTAAKIEVCTLLNSEEIETAEGWKPASMDPQSYGSTRTCQYQGPTGRSVVVVIATPVPKLASSDAMAQWRNKQVQRIPDLNVVVTPIEGLGVPAIRSEVDGAAQPTVEAAAGGVLLGVTASSFEVAKTLASHAITRLQ